MGDIRKQTLQSSVLVYGGFVFGAINTYLFTKSNGFTSEQYGLYQVIISIVQLLSPLATMGMGLFMYKFFPVYFKYSTSAKNDLLSVVLFVTSIGALLLLPASYLAEDVVIKKFGTNAPELVHYYYWVIVYAFFFTYFLVIESYYGALKKTILPNFLKETFWRFVTLVLGILVITKVISFKIFIISFCLIYAIIVAILLVQLYVHKQLIFTSKLSNVTHKIKKPARYFVAFHYSGILVNAFAKNIDTLALASVRGTADAGIFQFNQYLSSIIQVPFRMLQSISLPIISECWRNKNYAEINRIYKRSSINLLLVALFVFFNILLNYYDLQKLLHLNVAYATGFTIFFWLGISSIVELSTGVNYAIIGTSPNWRFDFWVNIIILVIAIPFNIIAIKWYGKEGAAYANCILFSSYNIIRLWFIKVKFGMWPFTANTYIITVLSIIYAVVAYYCGLHLQGIVGIVVRSGIFVSLFVATVWLGNITPDVAQLMETIAKRRNKKH